MAFLPLMTKNPLNLILLGVASGNRAGAARVTLLSFFPVLRRLVQILARSTPSAGSECKSHCFFSAVLICRRRKAGPQIVRRLASVTNP